MIDCRDVTKEYHCGVEKVVALNRLSLKMEAQERVALVGRSGSGKSSLLHLLSGMDRPTSGEIRIAGQLLSEKSPSAMADFRLRQIGVVFQSYQLIAHRTALENVELPMILAGVGRRARAARVREALVRVGLEHRLRHKPGQLSGGEQQRVAIARAIANRPAILFADEPTGNLDSATAERILDLLVEVSLEQKATILLITHDPLLADRFSNRIIRLIDGQIESAIPALPSRTAPDPLESTP
jgi:predicted ABC-type transport system involved in lysophospholipase L1 biosynthesis ATPase subunit